MRDSQGRKLYARGAPENVQHTLYGFEALLYKLSVLVLAVSLALLSAVDFKAMGESYMQKAAESAFACALTLRIVTPLQSLSALFIADVGRYVGHTAGELQEIRSVHCVEVKFTSRDYARPD